jgi:hypothetical protein
MDKLTKEALGQKISNNPEKGSSQWKRNESIIAKTPQLRRMRDIQQGFNPSSSISSGIPDEQYKSNYDKIQWNKSEDKPKPKFRVKINGVYQDEET